MKITKEQLGKIIDEEYKTMVDEGSRDPARSAHTSRLITKLELVLNTLDGAMGYIENPAAEQRFQRAADLGQELWEEMHELLEQKEK